MKNWIVYLAILVSVQSCINNAGNCNKMSGVFDMYNMHYNMYQTVINYLDSVEYKNMEPYLEIHYLVDSLNHILIDRSGFDQKTNGLIMGCSPVSQVISKEKFNNMVLAIKTIRDSDNWRSNPKLSNLFDYSLNKYLLRKDDSILQSHINNNVSVNQMCYDLFILEMFLLDYLGPA